MQLREKEAWESTHFKAFPRLISKFLEKNEVQEFINALLKT